MRQVPIASKTTYPVDNSVPIGEPDLGHDNLGMTAAPPRYVRQPPTPDPGLGARLVTHQDVVDAKSELQKGNIMPAAGLPAKAGEWPHGKRFMLESGVAGTGIFGGFISSSTTGEFNPDMFGWNAMHIYEQMRRTDADVACALFAMKLPLFSVVPEIVPGESAGSGDGNLAKELADLVRNNLFGGLERENPAFKGTWVSQSFNEVKENAFLMLDFGCSAHENLWRVDGDRLRLRYLAPRLPHTFYRFWTAEDGETLTGLEQLGYRRERYVNTTIPANNLALFVNRKEGSNFYGISSLRAAYQHWYMKSQFYRIDAIAMERNGMGIPWIKFPPGAKKEDVKDAQAWVEQMAVSERSGLTLPDGYEFEIAGLRGRLRDPINSIKHHSQEIVRSVMAMFIALGTTETGSRALASTLLDMFRQSLQHYAQSFCSMMDNSTIKQLVDMNYAPRNGNPLPYPHLVFPSIVVIDPVETAEILSKLATSQVDLIHPSIPLEQKLLQLFGMPYGGARTKYAPTVTQVRIMAQPVGETGTVGNTTGDQKPIEGTKPTDEQGRSIEPAQPTQPGDGGGDAVNINGDGYQIHDLLNQIVGGRHSASALKKSQPSSNGQPPRRMRMTEAMFNGIPINIENPIGSIRTGTTEDGHEWETLMKNPYGYVKGILGLDQEELDCFVGPNQRAKNVYVVRVKNPKRGIIEEEKVMLGFRSQSEAKNVFLKHYDDPAYFRDIRSMTVGRFKEWLNSAMGHHKGRQT